MQQKRSPWKWLHLLGIALVAGQSQDLPYAAEIAEFKRQDTANPPKKGQIVFIGSSSFTRWTDVGKSFPNRRILNRAFGGSQLGDIELHLDNVVYPYEPKQVVMYCGENDFGTRPELNASVVVDRFKRVYGKIRKRLPSLSFVYISMKPSPSRWSLAPKFRVANAAIKEFLKGERNSAYVDVWPVMLGMDGLPKPEIFVEDKLHLNDEGYKLWVPLLDRVLIGKRNPKN